MKTSILAIIVGIALLSTNVKAQETITIADTLDGWAFDWIAGVNGSQSTFKNYSRGGEDNVAATMFSLLNGAYKKGNITYGFVINLRYGVTKIDGEDTRKTDDRIAVRNRLAMILNDSNTLNGFAEVGFLTQFYNGFVFNDDGTRTLISDFFAPAYFTENVGIAYTPADYVSFEGGLGLKQTYVGQDALGPNFGVDPGENILAEGGLTTGISFKKDVLTNVGYVTRFETFTNLNKSVNSTDISWVNEVVGRINKYLTASFQFELLYDDDITTELQTRQVLSAGLLVNIF